MIPKEKAEIHTRMFRHYTSLTHKQASALRRALRKSGMRLPKQTMERVRLYYERVLGETAPLEVLAATGRPGDVPPCQPEALKLAQSLGLDIRLIPGTGPNQIVTVSDVHDRLRMVADAATEELAEKSTKARMALKKDRKPLAPPKPKAADAAPADEPNIFAGGEEEEK